jgi:hypothetical protein
MPQVNPGIAKGYALDFASPLRFVAEALNVGPRTVDDLCRAYEHDSAELARVWDHELRAHGQRRSARREIHEQRVADAKRWLLEAAIAALGPQLRAEDDRLVLAVPLAEVRVQGLPVAFPAPSPADRSESPRRVREQPAGRRAARPRSTPRIEKTATDESAEPETKPDPPNPLREWMERNGYTEERLALALGVEPAAVTSYLAGTRPVERVVWLALWALERGAEI